MNEARMECIRQLLTERFAPVSLEIEDQSHLHAGHAGAREGKGHFQVDIVAAEFDGLPMIKRHRLVYQALGDMLETDIHALIINATSPEA